MKRVVIDVGHRAKAAGACSRKFRICEYPFNLEIAEMVKQLVTKAEVVVTSRDPNSDSQTGLAAKINALKPNFVVSLHVNSATPTAQGTETLYFHSSVRSKQMAEIFQKHVLSALKFRDRKILPRKRTDRGGALLQLVNATMVLTEPFFFSNDSETEFVLNNKHLLAQAYAYAIDEVALLH